MLYIVFALVRYHDGFYNIFYLTFVFAFSNSICVAITTVCFISEFVTNAPSVMTTLKRNLSREKIKNSSPGHYSLEVNVFDNVNQSEKEIHPERLKRVSSSSSINSNCKLLNIIEK